MAAEGVSPWCLMPPGFVGALGGAEFSLWDLCFCVSGHCLCLEITSHGCKGSAGTASSQLMQLLPQWIQLRSRGGDWSSSAAL